MKNIQRQQGITGIGWLFILLVIGFTVLVVLKVFPMYTEYFSVKTSLTSLEKESLVGMDKAKIREMLMKRLDINDVKRAGKDDIEVTIGSGFVNVTVEYEAREPLFANISIVAEFKESIEVR